MDLDSVLTKLGDFGPYQRRVYFALCIVAFTAAFHNMGYVFWASRPDHWCHVPGTGHLAGNLSQGELRELTIPSEEGSQHSQCEFYDRDYESMTSAVALELVMSNSTHCTTNCTTSNITYCTTQYTDNCTVPVRKCTAWQYNTSQYTSTIVTKWDLVCDWRLLQSTSQSVYMAGRLVGVILFGHVADTLGRRRTLLVATLVVVLFSAASSVTPEFYSFLVFRFFTALGETGQFQTSYIITLEMVGTDWRTLAGTLFMVFWALGYLALAVIAYFIRDALALQLTLSLPCGLLCVYYWIIPETPRWLLIKGRTREATELLQKMAAVNGTNLPDDLDVTVKVESQTNASFLDLFRTSYIQRTSVILFYIWMVNSVVYFGLSLNTSNLGGNAFINFSIAGAVEIPGYALSYVFMQRLGRRIPQAGAMILAGVALLMVVPIPPEDHILKLTLSMVGKFAITASFGMIYIYTTELYPTSVRAIGVGCCAFMCRISGILAPFTGDMDTLFPGLSSLLFGVTSLVAGLLIFLLPETKGRTLPSTIREAELINQQGYSLDCCGENLTRPIASKDIAEIGMNEMNESTFMNS